MPSVGIDEVAARDALRRTLSSGAFARNERQSRFLRFLVERHLEGRDVELKESVIALEVFDRGSDYDPKVDAIVRTEAVRLRSRLGKYYETEGRLDPIAIEVPKGGYRPVFHHRAASAVESSPVPTTRRRAWLAAALVAVALTGAAAWRLVAAGSGWEQPGATAVHQPGRGAEGRAANASARRYEANLEAYDLYLRGRQVMAAFPARVRPVAMSAVAYYEAAIAKDARYAIAYAGMADAFIAVERNMGARNTINAWSRAKEAAARALELDPMLSEAHAAVAAIRAREYAWQDAERGFRRALELNPDNALAHLELGVRVLVVQGRFDESLYEVRLALRLDPLSPYVATEAGEALLLAGRYGEAVEQFRRAIVLDPSRNRPYHSMARALLLEGRPDEALEAHDRSVKLAAPPPDLAANWLTCIHMQKGRRDQAIALLDQARHSASSALALTRAHACVGDAEAVVASLEAALIANEPKIPEHLQAPELGFVRSDPRFAALRTKVGLQP